MTGERIPAVAAAIALACGTFVPATGAAQTMNNQQQQPGQVRITVENVTGRDGEEEPFNLSTLPINSQECSDNADISLDIRNIPTNRNVLDFWRSTGTDCSQRTNRSDETVEGCRHVELPGDVDTEIMGRSEKNPTIPIQELIPCDQGQRTQFQIYILAASSSMTTADIGQGFGRLIVELDTNPPSAPEDLEGRNGENTLGVSWSSTEQQLKEHQVFVDPMGCSGSPLLQGSGGDAGTNAPVPEGFEVVKRPNASATSTSIDPERFGIEVGGEAAIAVSRVDAALNVGPISGTCVRRIQTTGFCKARGGCPSGCDATSSFTRAAPGVSAALLGVLAVLGMGLRMRRRSRR